MRVTNFRRYTRYQAKLFFDSLNIALHDIFVFTRIKKINFFLNCERVITRFPKTPLLVPGVYNFSNASYIKLNLYSSCFKCLFNIDLNEDLNKFDLG